MARLSGAFFCAAVGFCGSAQAVSLAPDGSGQVLLYPYYTTHRSQDTLLVIGNRADVPQVVKLRFLEGYNGRPVLALDVYLDRNDVWTAVITEGEGDRAVLRTTDPGCTVPAVPAAGAVFSTAMFDGSGSLPADPGPHDATRTREGFIEVIAGATFGIGSPTALSIGRVEPACEQLPGSLFDDIDGPGQALYGTAAAVASTRSASIRWRPRRTTNAQAPLIARTIAADGQKMGLVPIARPQARPTIASPQAGRAGSSQPWSRERSDASPVTRKAVPRRSTYALNAWNVTIGTRTTIPAAMVAAARPAESGRARR